MEQAGLESLFAGFFATFLFAAAKAGHRIIPDMNREVVKMVPCSRWEETMECVDYHIKLAGLIEAPTCFRLLNNPSASVGPQQFSVASFEGPDPEAAPP